MQVGDLLVYLRDTPEEAIGLCVAPAIRESDHAPDRKVMRVFWFDDFGFTDESPEMPGIDDTDDHMEILSSGSSDG